MTRVVNLLFIADTIGQMVMNGVSMSNQWDLVNGRGSTGTEYGLLWVDKNFQRAPQYYALHLWSQFGSSLLLVASNVSAASTLSVYAGRRSTTVITVFAINKAGAPVTARVSLQGAVAVSAVANTAVGASLTDQTVTFNNVPDAQIKDDLSNAPAIRVPISGASFAYSFASNSVTLLVITVKAQSDSLPTFA